MSHKQNTTEVHMGECLNGANTQQRKFPTARTNGDSLVRLAVTDTTAQPQ